MPTTSEVPIASKPDGTMKSCHPECPCQFTPDFTLTADVWQPRPEYTKLFLERPERTAAVLQELYFSDDLALIPFLISLPRDLTRKQQDALWSSRFPIALMDIASEHKWYEWMTRHDDEETIGMIWVCLL